MEPTKSQKKKIVCAFGTFDVLHRGHIVYLDYARRQGSELTIVITRDSVVKRRKGAYPLFCEQDRIAMVRGLRSVDRAVLGDIRDTWAVVSKIHPACVCFGYDQQEAATSLRASRAYREAGNPRISIAPSYRPRTFHSRMIKQVSSYC